MFTSHYQPQFMEKSIQRRDWSEEPQYFIMLVIIIFSVSKNVKIRIFMFMSVVSNYLQQISPKEDWGQVPLSENSIAG